MTEKKTKEHPDSLHGDALDAALDVNNPTHSNAAYTSAKSGVKPEPAGDEKIIATADGYKPASEVKGTAEHKAKD